MGEFKNKIVWITGAAGGFGDATARMFAAEGAKLALIDLEQEALSSLCGDIETNGGAAEAVLLDISDRAAVNDAAASLLEKWGAVDILVNNAAINVREGKHLVNLKPEDWDRVLMVNLTGAYNMTFSVLPTMRRQKDGLIVNVSSGAGKIVTSALSGTAYTAAKHGLNGLSHSISKEEAANGIRATALMPGEANTPWARKRTGTNYTKEEEARLLQPEDVANAIRFLALLPARVTVPEMPLQPANKALKPHHQFPN